MSLYSCSLDPILIFIVDNDERSICELCDPEGY